MVGTSKGVSQGYRPQRDVKLVGRLVKVQTPVDLPAGRGLFCRAVCKVHEQEFIVFAYGSLADALGGIATGTVVVIEGELAQHTWTTHDGKPRERIVIEARKISLWDAQS